VPSETQGRGNTKAFAHESQTKYSVIQTNYSGQGVIQDLYDEFVKERQGQKTTLADNILVSKLCCDTSQ
jgi:hypothetical protein